MKYGSVIVTGRRLNADRTLVLLIHSMETTAGSG
jgi:hypothetical protein